MRIGITYNLKSDVPTASLLPFPEDIAEEFDLPETIEAIRDALSKGGHEVHLLGGDLSTLEKIKRFDIEFVFNIAEGFSGRSREAQIPALLELLGIPYSGSDPLGLAITLDKALAKRVALSAGIPTPEFWILDQLEDLKLVGDRFPLFVKPLWQGSSIGITLSSKVNDRSQLEREAKRLIEHFPKEPVLVEEYISGRELTVGVVGNNPPEVLGVMEITFRDPAKKDFCYAREVKWNWKKEVDYYVPPRLDPDRMKNLERFALSLFKTLRLRDVARFDFRMDSEGTFYFLEVNPLPGLSPESGDLVIMSRKKGLSFEALILKIFHAALERYPQFSYVKAGGRTHA